MVVWPVLAGVFIATYSFTSDAPSAGLVVLGLAAIGEGWWFVTRGIDFIPSELDAPAPDLRREPAPPTRRAWRRAMAPSSTDVAGSGQPDRSLGSRSDSSPLAALSQSRHRGSARSARSPRCVRVAVAHLAIENDARVVADQPAHDRPSGHRAQAPENRNKVAAGGGWFSRYVSWRDYAKRAARSTACTPSSGRPIKPGWAWQGWRSKTRVGRGMAGVAFGWPQFGFTVLTVLFMWMIARPRGPLSRL